MDESDVNISEPHVQYEMYLHLSCLHFRKIQFQIKEIRMHAYRTNTITDLAMLEWIDILEARSLSLFQIVLECMETFSREYPEVSCAPC